MQRNLKQNKKQEVLTMKYETTCVVRSLQQRCKVPKGDYDKISLNLQRKPQTLKQIGMRMKANYNAHKQFGLIIYFKLAFGVLHM